MKVASEDEITQLLKAWSEGEAVACRGFRCNEVLGERKGGLKEED